MLDTNHPNYPELQKRLSLVAERVLQWRAERLELEAAQSFSANRRTIDAPGLLATAEVETVGAVQSSPVTSSPGPSKARESV